MNNEFIILEGIRLQVRDATGEVAQVKRVAGDIRGGKYFGLDDVLKF